MMGVSRSSNAMKFCYECQHITPGQPLFCNQCGRSYDVKLCPRHHVNPRTAEVCSQCGSRDLSTPQPRVPQWTPIVGFLLSVVPGAFLTVASLVIGLALIVAVLQRPDMIVYLTFLGMAYAVLWWAWSQIPQWFRTRISRLLHRRRERSERGGR